MAGRNRKEVVLLGPRQPEWGCPKCGCSTNWRSRIKCKGCGEDAPQSVTQKAKAAHRAEQSKPAPAAARRPGGAWREGPPGHKAPNQDSLDKKVAEPVAEQLAKLQGKKGTDIVVFAGKGSGDKDGGSGDDKETAAKRKRLHDQIATLLAWDDINEASEEIKSRRAQLAQLQTLRPAHIQMRDAKGKLDRAKKKLEAAVEERKELERAIKELHVEEAKLQCEVERME